jgi:type VI secretion system protein ImpF
MPRFEEQGIVTLSVLDRLIDLNPKNESEPPPSRNQSVRQLRAALKRDLEWLLNTRRIPEPAPDALKEVAHSLYNYGLPDLVSFGVHNTKDQLRLAWLLESTISIFEPRLQDVTVTLEPVAGQNRVLRFLIQGLLRMDPAPEQISFDTVLELSSGEYQVRGEPSAG